MIFALLCAVAQGALATDYSVGTDSELRAAIANDGANIIVTADIDLSNSTLVIGSNKTVTIDLGGHTLDRGLTSRDYDHGGQVITVRSGATLNLSNGTLRGGWGGNGGGIANEGGTAALSNVTITGCVADDRGGGISNGTGGTLTMTGCTITDNISYDKTAPKGGGGIYNAGTLNIQGTNIINDNWKSNGMRSNLYLKNGTVITITGALADSHVFVDMETLGTFTSGYSTYHDIHPAGFFTADKQSITGMRLVAGEAQLNNAIPEGGVYYVERSWNETAKRVEATYHTLEENQYITLTGSDDDTYLDPGWYAVKGSDVVYDDYLYMNGGGEYHLILCDGASIKAMFFIVESPNILHIHGQTDNTGKMVSTYVYNFTVHKCAGIGGTYHNANGPIFIHGGDIDVHATLSSAGIGGGGYTSQGGPITIYGGTVHTEGGWEPGGSAGETTGGGAGIGGGRNGDGGVVNIYGGSVYATGRGNTTGGAGIGSGSYADNSGTISIYGGYVEAKGYFGAAGIGGGTGTNGADVTIHGGTVKAEGRSEGPGIGAGKNDDNSITYAGTLTVTGGKVYAYGAQRGAGIGGGWNTNGSNVTISGGYVYAEGGQYAAGIGSGCEYSSSDNRHGGTLTVTGGYVEAHGGEDGAGIGGGEDADGGTVNISGGEVRAYGTDNGAGIGGSEDGNGGNVTITGGIVIAESGGDQRAIGAGSDSDSHGSLNLAENLGVFVTTNLYRSEKDNRVVDCRNFSYVRINECSHGNATFTDNGSSVSVDCPYCYANTMPYTFKANGNWNDGSKWFAGYMPHEGKDVDVKARATIPADCCAHVGNITLDGGSITIADGGQLIHNNADVTATMQKNIGKYTVDSGAGTANGWYFITSPVCTEYTPKGTMLSNTYDLYRLNNTVWENWKQSGDHHHFHLENSRGYLYANSEDVMLGFTGVVLPSAASKTVDVNVGFNLIGNPFLHDVYADRVYYKMNSDRTGIVAVEDYQSNPIAPCTSILINADAAGSVTISKAAPSLSNNNGSLNISLAKVCDNRDASTRSAIVQDNAIVSFNQGATLPKFRFGNNAEIYIPQDGDDYAIAFAEKTGEMPLHFRAKETGRYTITVKTCHGASLQGIKLIDKFENKIIDLNINNNYTFIGSTADSHDRFVIVFKNSEFSDNSEIFAYQSGNDIIVSGEGELQVFDVMGRMVMTQRVNGVETCHGASLQTGVYIFRLNEKTQKIVVK